MIAAARQRSGEVHFGSAQIANPLGPHLPILVEAKQCWLGSGRKRAASWHCTPSWHHRRAACSVELPK